MSFSLEDIRHLLLKENLLKEFVSDKRLASECNRKS